MGTAPRGRVIRKGVDVHRWRTGGSICVVAQKKSRQRLVQGVDRVNAGVENLGSDSLGVFNGSREEKSSASGVAGPPPRELGAIDISFAVRLPARLPDRRQPLLVPRFSLSLPTLPVTQPQNAPLRRCNGPRPNALNAGAAPRPRKRRAIPKTTCASRFQAGACRRSHRRVPGACANVPAPRAPPGRRR